MFLVAVVATVTGATITLYEAYEKYYVRPAQEVELSRLKKENAELKEERDLLKKENAKIKEGHQNIRGLQIAVCDALAMSGVEGIKNLTSVFDRVAYW
jgi:cell division protein FtsB